MDRRSFTLVGFFGGIGAMLGRALGYDGTPPPAVSQELRHPPVDDFTKLFGGIDEYTIKVGRKILRLPNGVLGEGGWDVHSAVASDQHSGDSFNGYNDEGEAQYHQVPRLSPAPEGTKSWKDAPAVYIPSNTAPTYATLRDLESLRDQLDEIAARPQWAFTEYESRKSDITALSASLSVEIARHQNWCHGHNGPAPGEMTRMPFGRRLCAYCYKQEIENGDRSGSDRDQAPSA